MATTYGQNISTGVSTGLIFDYGFANPDDRAFITSIFITNTDSLNSVFDVYIDDSGTRTYLLYQYDLAASGTIEVCKDGKFIILPNQQIVIEQGNGFLHALTSYFEITP